MTFNLELIGEQVYRRRGHWDFTQDELARMVEVSRTQIVNIEAGRSLPSLETLCRLADALGCSIDYLVGRRKRP